MVCLSISTYPAGFAGSASGVDFSQSGADWGGTRWSMSKSMESLVLAAWLAMVARRGWAE